MSIVVRTAQRKAVEHTSKRIPYGYYVVVLTILPKRGHTLPGGVRAQNPLIKFSRVSAPVTIKYSPLSALPLIGSYYSPFTFYYLGSRFFLGIGIGIGFRVGLGLGLGCG